MFQEIKRMFRDSAIYGLGSVLPKAAGIILVPIYTRFLLPSDYGILSFVSMLASMASAVLLLGQNGAVILFFRSSDETDAEPGEYLFTITSFTMVAALALLVPVFALGPQLMSEFVRDKALTFYPYMALGLAGVYLSIPLLLLQSVYRAKGRALVYSGFQIVSFLLTTGFAIYLVVFKGMGAVGSLGGAALSAGVLFPIACLLLFRRMRPRFSRSALRRSLSFGLPLVPHFFSGWVLTFSDRYILERFTSLTQVGLYSLAYNLSMAMNLLTSALAEAWAPIYYDLAGREDGRRMLPRLNTIYAAGVSFIGSGFVLLIRELLMLLAASRYWQSAGVVPIVAAGYYFFALYAVFSTGFFYKKKTGYAPILSGMAAVLNIGLNLWLVPRYGMYAAAWSTLVAFLLMALGAHYFTQRLLPGTFENGQILKTVLVFVAACALNYVILTLGFGLGVTIALKLLVVLLVAASFVLARIVTVDELRSFLLKLRPTTSMADAGSEREAHLEGYTADDSGYGEGS